MQDFTDWISSFHNDGYLVVPNVLTTEICSQLMEDLDHQIYISGHRSRFVHRIFEVSNANLQLFWQEPIVSFAEALIADNGSTSVFKYKDGIPSANETHIIHNNSFVIRAGRDGLAGNRWHQDDTPHITSLNGEPITNVRLNVLAFTCLYYLTDVLSIENGPTQFIRGSHLFGKHCDGDIAEYENLIVSALGSAGTCVMVNNQTWHRGSFNSSKIDRYCTQITYAKRLIGHKYGNFMNYQMPQEIYENIEDPRKLRLLGFLGHGAYG
jgi:Phytanoyl-CoA dioxygenase (PhyH)